jgi:acetyl esterase/lipase
MPKALSVAILLHLVLASDATSVSLADQPVPVVSGTAVATLGEKPPEPPKGFASSEEAFAAVKGGKVPVVNPFVPVPKNVLIKSNIEYGHSGSRPLLLDLYSPKDLSEPVPAIVFIHGGSWKHGKKEDYRIYALHFAKLGYIVASVQYRLSREAPFPAAVHDVKAAVRFMRAEAESLNVDPDRIAVGGGSAGGHLTMMIGYSSDVKELAGNSGHEDVSSRVRCIVNLYGPTDMTTEYARNISTTNSAVRDFFEGTYDEQPQNYAAGSPLHYVTRDDPPTLILHGTADALVPINQADILAQKLTEVGVPYIYDRLPGWPHGMDVAKPVHERVLWYMERFFDHHLRESDSEG